jgi:hypothetical protein
MRADRSLRRFSKMAGIRAIAHERRRSRMGSSAFESRWGHQLNQWLIEHPSARRQQTVQYLANIDRFELGRDCPIFQPDSARCPPLMISHRPRWTARRGTAAKGIRCNLGRDRACVVAIGPAAGKGTGYPRGHDSSRSLRVGPRTERMGAISAIARERWPNLVTVELAPLRRGFSSPIRKAP